MNTPKKPERPLRVTDRGYRAGRAPANKGRTYPPEPLGLEHTNRLLETCARRSTTGVRNRALLATLFFSGARLEETLRLAVRDVHLEEGALRIRFPKGARRRRSPAPARTVKLFPPGPEIVATWIKERERAGLARSAPLFCSIGKRGGKRLHQSYVRALMRRAASRARLEERVAPHGARHTAAVLMRRAGASIEEVQFQLGHSTLAHTARYLLHLDPEERLAALDRIRFNGRGEEPKPDPKAEALAALEKRLEEIAGQLVALRAGEELAGPAPADSGPNPKKRPPRSR